MSLYLLVGHLSTLDTENLSVSCCGFNSSHSYIKWSMCRSSLPQGHVGESIILKLYRYALIFPWPVRMVVRTWFVYIASCSVFLQLLGRRPWWCYL